MSEPRQILLNVEAREFERKLRTRALRAAGFEVLEAESGEGAVIAAGRDVPSVALIDAHLPDTSSAELCETLKQLRPGLVVVLVASDGDMTADAAWSYGADACVSGSCAPDALVPLVMDEVAREVNRRAARPWVVSDETGHILDANPHAAALLNHAVKGLRQKNLLLFFEQDRDAWRAAVERAASGERVHQHGSLRPKERRPVRVGVEVRRCPEWDVPALRWVFEVDRVPAGPLASR
jgi:DNA-binding response OmpR family regulator